MRRKHLPSWLMLFGLFALFASPVMAGGFDIKTAEMSKLSCKDYTLRVTGTADKGYCVAYMFTLTTGQDPSTTVMGTIPVDGTFDTSVTGSFSLATDGGFTGFGVASLKTSCLSGGTVVNTVPIDFGGVTPLTCPSTPSPKVSIIKFTNGHDGDNANGVPDPNPGNFAPGTGTVAQIPASSPVTWTYRVTNTGNEPLVNVNVSDNQVSPVICPDPKDFEPLLPGQSVDCTATGVAKALQPGTSNVEGCGSDTIDTRPTYENIGTVEAYTTGGTRVTDSNPSHYCNPKPSACNLDLNKSCEIVQPPTADWATCKGKLQQFSLIWPSTGGTINISGIANDAPGGVVNPGQRVTFTGPWTTNDLFLNISGAQTGQSQFHVSCSDRDMDGITATNLEQQQLPGKTQDCGKFEGNGKDKTGINTWLLDGLVDAEGKVLNCSPTPTPPTSSCSFQQEDPPSCGTGGSFKPSTLTFQYTGGGCLTQNNSQATGKTSCSGSIDPTNPVNVTFPGGTANNVQPGGTFTMPRTQTQSLITLTNAGGTESDSIHTSCSQPLIVGDVYFSLTLVAQDGIGVGKQVKYNYDVTNTGLTTATGISVTDDKLGIVPGSPIASLVPGETKTLSATTLIAQTTTNVATATAASCPPPGVKATATVTVLPPPPCTVTDSFASLADDKIVYKVTNTGKKVVTLDTLTLNFPSARQQIKEVKLDGSIYKADSSNLDVTTGVKIDSNNWTNPDVTKRQLNPGEARNLEITFTKKAKASASDFSGTATFKEGCEIDLP